jgi:hypothetical protein
MKASELRLGNLTSAGVVNEILQDCFYVHDGESSLKSEWFDIQPIPITEEWLLKFGFKQNLDKWFEVNYFTDCTLSAEKMGILINLCSNRCAILDTDTDQQSAMTANRIYYIHQLQNLYFALAGEELTISNL